MAAAGLRTACTGRWPSVRPACPGKTNPPPGATRFWPGRNKWIQIREVPRTPGLGHVAGRPETWEAAEGRATVHGGGQACHVGTGHGLAWQNVPQCSVSSGWPWWCDSVGLCPREAHVCVGNTCRKSASVAESRAQPHRQLLELYLLSIQGGVEAIFTAAGPQAARGRRPARSLALFSPALSTGPLLSRGLPILATGLSRWRLLCPALAGHVLGGSGRPPLPWLLAVCY